MSDFFALSSIGILKVNHLLVVYAIMHGIVKTGEYVDKHVFKRQLSLEGILGVDWV